MKETRIIRGVHVWDRKAKRTVVIDVDVEIDPVFVAHELAGRAYNNKRRKSSVLCGVVEVRMRGTKATPVRDAVA